MLRDDERAIHLARRSGLRNEGHVRAAPRSGEPDHVLLARLVDDPDPGDRAGFRALLNSFLPRKRVIAQALVRDDAGRVLMCHPTYKDDWDLPGGVVEAHESPRDAAGREVLEELALDLAVGGLVLADWMPPWSGWDDALCLVFDAGRHPASLVSRAVLQARESGSSTSSRAQGAGASRGLHGPPRRRRARRGGGRRSTVHRVRPPRLTACRCARQGWAGA